MTILNMSLDQVVLWNVAVVTVVQALLAEIKVAFLADATVPVMFRNGEMAVVAADAEGIERWARVSRHVRLCRHVHEGRELSAERSRVVVCHVLPEIVQIGVDTVQLASHIH